MPTNVIFNRSVGLLFVGLLQGSTFWWLTYATEHTLWPAKSPGPSVSILFAALALPLTIYWTGRWNASVLVKASAIISISLLFALVGWHQGRTSAEFRDSARTAVTLFETGLIGRSLVAFTSGAMLIHLWACRRGGYKQYFEVTWHNAIATKVAMAFASVTWLMVLAGGWLLSTVGIDFIGRVAMQPWFFMPLTAVAFAFGMLSADRWSTLTDSFRRGWLSLCAYLLPVALAFGVVWVIAAPIAGFNGTFEKSQRGLANLLFWFVALCVYFLNATWQDGDAIVWRKPLVLRTLRWTWLVVPIVTIVAIGGLAIRVRQYGWTEDRIWSALVGTLALIYSLGYALPAKDSRWFGAIGRINIATAWFAVVAMLALLTPLADARKIAVASQVAQLSLGRISADKFDYRYLSHRTGSYGRAALAKLALLSGSSVNDDIAREARRVIDNRSKNGESPPPIPSPTPTSPSPSPSNASVQSIAPLSLLQVRERIEVWPKNRTVDDRFFERFRRPNNDFDEQQCLNPGWNCGVWQQDFDGDGRDEIGLLQAHVESGSRRLFVFCDRDGAIQRCGEAKPPASMSFDDWRQATSSELPKLVLPRWSNLVINQEVITILPE